MVRLEYSDISWGDGNRQQECVLPRVVASKCTELSGATIDAPVENKPKGLWCGSHNDRGRPTMHLVLMPKKFGYNESRRLK